MDIGTAKPEPHILESVKHYFIDHKRPDEYYSAGLFGRESRSCIQELLQTRRMALVVGGSGLYIKALIEGFFNGHVRDFVVRERLMHRLEEDGLDALYQTLKEVDPDYSRKISPNDRQRVLRSLEVYYSTGKPFSEFHRTAVEPAPFRTVMIGLTMERPALYERINQRVEAMLKRGLIEEVEWLQEHGYDLRYTALNTVGYREVFQYLNRKLSYDEMVEQIKRNTRRYAKRQLTWFRSMTNIHWITIQPQGDDNEIAAYISRNIFRKYNLISI